MIHLLIRNPTQQPREYESWFHAIPYGYLTQPGVPVLPIGYAVIRWTERLQEAPVTDFRADVAGRNLRDLRPTIYIDELRRGVYFPMTLRNLDPPMNAEPQPLPGWFFNPGENFDPGYREWYNLMKAWAEYTGHFFDGPLHKARQLKLVYEDNLSNGDRPTLLRHIESICDSFGGPTTRFGLRINDPDQTQNAIDFLTDTMRYDEDEDAWIWWPEEEELEE